MLHAALMWDDPALTNAKHSLHAGIDIMRIAGMQGLLIDRIARTQGLTLRRADAQRALAVLLSAPGAVLVGHALHHDLACRPNPNAHGAHAGPDAAAGGRAAGAGGAAGGAGRGAGGPRAAP